MCTLGVLLVVFVVVLGKVGLMQTTRGGALRAAGAQQWSRDRILPAQRGAIFDRNGDELALSVPASTIVVNPTQVEDPAGTADVFAAILGLTPERRNQLEATMAAQDSGFLYVARQVDDTLAEQVAALRLVGVLTYREDRRMLPGGATARSIVGDTDIDGRGISGIELQYNRVLRGREGSATLDVAPGGRSVAGTEQVVQAPVAGDDLVLSIDRSVQYATEQALLRRVAATGARGGQAIVMDTDTGDIIAMASVRINDDGVYEITSGNFSAVDAYEPGSVGKVITISAALEERSVQTDTSFMVPWREWYSDRYLSDSHEHPTEPLTVHQILVESSNIGTIKVGQTMSYETQYEYMRAFGLGDQTALDFPGESAGILHPWQTWEGTEKYTVYYGQGVASSPIQLVSAVNTIANDGVYVAPRLVSATVADDGELIDADPSAAHRVISERTATTMQQLMKDVVCDGTATRAQVEGMSIAGKTGTGYKAQANGTYFNDDGSRAYYASFVGFFPAEDPQVSILVSIDEPRADSDDRFGGTAAAPVFQELAPTMVHELGIEQPAGSTGCTGE